MAEIAKTGIQTWSASGDISAAPALAIASSIRIPGRGTTAQRDAAWPMPTSAEQGIAMQGAEWVNTETGFTERYYWDWNASTNPGGSRSQAGWKSLETPLITIPSNMYQAGYTQSGSQPLSYIRVNGFVDLSGIVNRSPTNKTGVIFTLPLGFRPRVSKNGVVTASGTNVAEISVSPSTGEVSLVSNLVASAGFVVSLSFPSYI